MKMEVSTQPETYTRLIVRSLKLYRHAFLHVIVLSILLSILVATPRLLTLLIGQNIFLNQQLFSLTKLWLVVINLFCMFFFTAMLWRIRCVISHSHESIFDDMKIAIRKLPYIFVAAIVSSVILAAVVFAFSVLGFYFLLHQHQVVTFDLRYILLHATISIAQFVIFAYLFLSFYFYLAIILTENKKIFSSLGESIVLVWGNWWRTFFIQVTPWVAYLLILFILRDFLKINIHIYLSTPEEHETVLSAIIQILLFAIFMPWIGSTILVQLRDLELRKGLGLVDNSLG